MDLVHEAGVKIYSPVNKTPCRISFFDTCFTLQMLQLWDLGGEMGTGTYINPLLSTSSVMNVPPPVSAALLNT